MRLSCRLLAAVLLSLGSAVVMATPANADAEITVTPNMNLTDGQTVMVHGSGFLPNEQLEAIQCFFGPVGSECNNPLVVMAGGNGEISFPFVVHAKSLGLEDCQGLSSTCDIRFFARQEPIAPISFVPLQYLPDAQIRNRATQVLSGNDIYDPSGFEQQQRARRVALGEKWTFAVRIQNDGTQTDDIVVTAPASSGEVFVRYFFSYFDITPSVTSSGFAFRSLASGSAVQLGVRFEVPLTAPVDLVERSLLTFTSAGDPNRSDAVRLRITTQASP